MDPHSKPPKSTTEQKIFLAGRFEPRLATKRQPNWRKTHKNIVRQKSSRPPVARRVAWKFYVQRICLKLGFVPLSRTRLRKTRPAVCEIFFSLCAVSSLDCKFAALKQEEKTKPKSFDQKVPGPMSPGGSPGMLLSNALAKYFCNRFDLVHPKGETYKKYNLVCFAFWVDEIETAERRRETKRRRGTYTFTIAGSWKWFLIVCCLRKRYQPLDMWNWMFVLPECTAWGLDAYRMSIWKPMHLSRYWCVYCKCIVCNLVSSTLSYEAADHLCLNILCVCSHTYLYIHIAI